MPTSAYPLAFFAAQRVVKGWTEALQLMKPVTSSTPCLLSSLFSLCPIVWIVRAKSG